MKESGNEWTTWRSRVAQPVIARQPWEEAEEAVAVSQNVEKHDISVPSSFSM